MRFIAIILPVLTLAAAPIVEVPVDEPVASDPTTTPAPGPT